MQVSGTRTGNLTKDSIPEKPFISLLSHRPGNQNVINLVGLNFVASHRPKFCISFQVVPGPSETHLGMLGLQLPPSGIVNILSTDKAIQVMISTMVINMREIISS